MKTESLELLESIIADAGGVVSPRGTGAAAARGDGGAPAPMESDDELECEDGLAADELAAPFARGLSLCSDGMADAGDALDDDFDATVDSLLGGMADAAPPGAPVKTEEDDDAAADAARAARAARVARAARRPSPRPPRARPAPRRRPRRPRRRPLSAALLAPRSARRSRSARQTSRRAGRAPRPRRTRRAPRPRRRRRRRRARRPSRRSARRRPSRSRSRARRSAFFANLTAAQQQQWQQVLARQRACSSPRRRPSRDRPLRARERAHARVGNAYPTRARPIPSPSLRFEPGRCCQLGLLPSPAPGRPLVGTRRDAAWATLPPPPPPRRKQGGAGHDPGSVGVSRAPADLLANGDSPFQRRAPPQSQPQPPERAARARAPRARMHPSAGVRERRSHVRCVSAGGRRTPLFGRLARPRRLLGCELHRLPACRRCTT